MNSMITLCIRTDNPTAELYLYNGTECIASVLWEAHRMLAETIHGKIDELLASKALTLKDINKIVVYEGPGSFTGLRIGVSVANTLTYGLGVSIVASSGDKWARVGAHQPGDYASIQPVYGQDPHITQQKK